MKVLIYAINGRGMGHLNRTLILARALRAGSAESHVEFIVGSPLFGLVSDSGFAVTKVPDLHHRLGFFRGLQSQRAHQQRIFDTLLEAIAPDVFIIDFVVDEGLFAAAQRQGARLALIYRKQRPEQLATWQGERCVEAIDHFLLPHDETELGLHELPEQWQQRSVYLGPLSRELDVEAIPSTRARFASNDERLVVVSIGGGGFPESYRTLAIAEAAAAAFTHTQDGHAVRWVIVYGPYYRKEVPASTAQVSRVHYEANLPELFASADAVICNAGYNTVRELMVSGSPGIVIPLKTTGRDDQMERARTLQAMGTALVCEEDEHALIRNVRSLLDDHVLLRRAPHVGGSARALGLKLVQTFRRQAQSQY